MARRLRSLVAGALTAVLPWLLAGCAPVGHDYGRPPMNPPPEYRFIDVVQADSFADVPWWEVFEDPALQALVREAIANNLDLRAAVARVGRARAQAGVAESFLYPQVDGTASHTVRQWSGGEDGVTQGGIYGAELSWELDLFGRIRRETESALAFMMSTEQARRGVMVALVSGVASNYFLLRQLDAQLAIARETLRVNDETVLYFRNRLEGGVSNRLELDRISANRANTATTIPDLEQQIAVAENELSLLVGRTPGPIARDSGQQRVAPPIPAGLPASLLERRPDVLQAEQLLVAANADVGVAKALFFPTISLTGLLGVVSGDVISLLSGGRTGAGWSVTPGLLQPVFNKGRLRQNLEAAQASFNEAVALYQQSALNGYREVSNALVTIQKLSSRRTELELGVTLLADAADLSRARYDTGLANYIEILTADERLFGQQLRLAETHGGELRARTELYRALGGGWQP